MNFDVKEKRRHLLDNSSDYYHTIAIFRTYGAR